MSDLLREEVNDDCPKQYDGTDDVENDVNDQGHFAFEFILQFAVHAYMTAKPVTCYGSRFSPEQKTSHHGNHTHDANQHGTTNGRRSTLHRKIVLRGMSPGLTFLVIFVGRRVSSCFFDTILEISCLPHRLISMKYGMTTWSFEINFTKISSRRGRRRGLRSIP